MKRRCCSLLLVLAVFAILILAVVTADSGVAAVAETGGAGGHPPAQRPARQDPDGTINGAQNPELISDRTAYILLFRLMAGRRTEEERVSMRFYLRQQQPNFSDHDVESLLAAADEFMERAGALYRQAKEFKDQYWPDPPPEVMERLRDLQLQKELAADEIISSLPARLSDDGLQKTRWHVRAWRLTDDPAAAHSDAAPSYSRA